MDGGPAARARAGPVVLRLRARRERIRADASSVRWAARILATRTVPRKPLATAWILPKGV